MPNLGHKLVATIEGKLFAHCIVCETRGTVRGFTDVVVMVERGRNVSELTLSQAATLSEKSVGDSK
jgi:hypothetical protein